MRMAKRKKRTILEFTNHQDTEVDEEGNPTENWRRYEMYLQDMASDEEHVLESDPLTFEDWKKENVSEEPVVEEPKEGSLQDMYNEPTPEEVPEGNNEEPKVEDSLQDMYNSEAAPQPEQPADNNQNDNV